MRRAPRAPRGLVALLIAAVTAAVLSGVAPVATAADLSQFNPGSIITDADFYNRNALSPQATAQFVAAQGQGCTAANGAPCLKDYRQSTPNRGGDAFCPGGYSGRTLEPASDIVWKVAQGCGISPEVLLVMLQKEEGLVQSRAPYTSSYDSAMGQGCPDTAGCDAFYTGFFNQVYGAAAQLQRYRLDPTSYGYRAGLTNNILYNPNRACGSSPVFIANQATAGLYNYTPYQPNVAALAAGWGTGDACSAYGNRNFWNYYNTWFGPNVVRNAAPVGSLDSVDWSAAAATITVRGWAVDPDTASPIQVHVYIDGQGTPLVANGPRADVDAALGTTGDHGFSVVVPAGNSLHQVCAYGIDSAGGPNTTLGCQLVGNHPPVGSIDSLDWAPTDSSTGVVYLRGWVVDPDTASAIQVHVYIDGQRTVLLANVARSDVNAALSTTGNHGFVATLPTTNTQHQVCLYGIDAAGGVNTSFGCSTVGRHPPVGNVDSVTWNPAYSGVGSISTRGWVLDPDNPAASSNVATYVDSTGVAGTAGLDRPDVNAALGITGQHGFVQTLNSGPGRHNVCTYVTDPNGGPPRTLNCQVITANAAPIGALDSATAAAGILTTAGWAIDPDTGAPIDVAVYVDGVGVAVAQANRSRADVSQAYPGAGDQHGYRTASPVPSGAHTVCVYALDTTGGPNTTLGCQAFTS